MNKNGEQTCGRSQRVNVPWQCAAVVGQSVWGPAPDGTAPHPIPLVAPNRLGRRRLAG